MKFKLQGQLRGPETRAVMTQAVKLRRKIEPIVEAHQNEKFKELSIVLRVGGSLGSFGENGVENIEVDGEALICDLVIADQNWGDRTDAWIYGFLNGVVLEAIHQCLKFADIECSMQSLRSAASGKT